MPFVGVMTTQRVITLLVTSNVEDYNLFTEAGNPNGNVIVNLTVNAAIVSNFLINSFSSLATLTVTCLNGGMIYGNGGAAGKGGTSIADVVPVEGAGTNGSAGKDALTTHLNVNLNIDAGFLFGGGGGGGGGAGAASTARSGSGGGGGGGQGHTGGAGASAGITLVQGTAGTAGTVAAAGTGGTGGVDSTETGGAGGNGGIWATAGSNGTSGTGAGTLGTGGAAGKATTSIGGAVVTLSGLKNQATLISEGRIKGTLG